MVPGRRERRALAALSCPPSADSLDRIFAVLDVVAEEAPRRGGGGQAAECVGRHSAVFEGPGREFDDEGAAGRVVADRAQVAAGKPFHLHWTIVARTRGWGPRRLARRLL